MAEKPMDEVMEAAAGVHFSGLRLSSPSTPSTPSSAKAVQLRSREASTSAAEVDAPRQPFVIGN